MPCRVSSDAHEWNNESPTVPAYNPVKPHKVDEQSINFHRGEKTPWSFTAACACGIVRIAQGIWEPCLTLSGVLGSNDVTPDSFCSTTYPVKTGDMCRWAVRLGRHPFEKISKGPKVEFKRGRNPLKRAKPKTRLNGFPNARNS